MSNIKRLLVFFIVLNLAFSSGCIKRNLHIKSDPPGATVYFNEDKIGETPLDYDFIYYDVHRVTLKKDGYETLESLERIKSPKRFWIPLDLVFQLIPRTFWDKRELSYTLTPSKAE